MLVKLLVTEVLQQAQPVLSPAKNVQPVTNGTSPLERLPDHLLTTFGSGSREMRRGGQHPFFFVCLTAAGLHQQTLLPFLLQLVHAGEHAWLHWKVAQ